MITIKPNHFVDILTDFRADLRNLVLQGFSGYIEWFYSLQRTFPNLAGEADLGSPPSNGKNPWQAVYPPAAGGSPRGGLEQGVLA